MSIRRLPAILPVLQCGVSRMATASRLSYQPFLWQHLSRRAWSHCAQPSLHILRVGKESSICITHLNQRTQFMDSRLACSHSLSNPCITNERSFSSRTRIESIRNLHSGQLLCNKYEHSTCVMWSRACNFGCDQARNFTSRSDTDNVQEHCNLRWSCYPFSTGKRLIFSCNTDARSGHQSCLCNLNRRQRYGTSAAKETGDPLSPDSAQFKCYIEHLRKEQQTLSSTLQGGESLSDYKQKDLRGRHTEISSVLDKWDELVEAGLELSELETLVQGSAETSQDKEMQELASAEKDELVTHIAELKEELLDLMTPSQDTDDNDVILEFSAGVGGQEAMLFAADMFNMYEKYAAYRNWTFTVLEYFTTDLGGLRHASVSISGDQAYRLLRIEGGVHRVQRVPKTEKQGRIHTSTMTIAVLPQPKEIDLKIDPKDLRIETKKASGAGGQHVNTTDSAVRITHIPTGTTAESQQERSQHKNRAIAMTILQTRIYNRILEEQTSSERSLRRSQVGTSGRSEKIRTYNYQQDRITDHRISRNVHDVADYLTGSDLLDEMIFSVIEREEQDELKQRILDIYESTQKEAS